MPEVWTPQRAATRLVKLAEAFSTAHGLERFPVEVAPIALEAANIFGWSDPITQVQAANIPGFEGALFPGEDRKEWLLLYNQSMSSPGRVRFTQAHELGHYILHRQLRESFNCSDADMHNWSADEKDIEGQADLFASYLLMPLDDFRRQVNEAVDLDQLGPLRPSLWGVIDCGRPEVAAVHRREGCTGRLHRWLCQLGLVKRTRSEGRCVSANTLQRDSHTSGLIGRKV